MQNWQDIGMTQIGILPIIASAVWMTAGMAAIRFGMPKPESEVAAIVIMILMIGCVFSSYFLHSACAEIERTLRRRRQHKR